MSDSPDPRQLDEAGQRPRLYWNVDGLPEVVLGGLWILWALMLVVMELAPARRWLLPLGFVLPILIAVLSVMGNSIVKKLKARITYPRTGYVALPDPGPWAKIVPALLAGAVGTGLVVLVAKGKGEPLKDLVAPAIGLLLAVAFLVAARKQRMPHLVLLSAVSLLLAAILGIRRVEMNAAMIWFLLVLGSLSAAMGGVRLRRFLRHNPPPSGQAE